MAEKALSTLRNLASRIPGLKAPWKLTGVASTPEFLDAAPAASDYRRHSPGSVPTKPLIPHANPETVYDIKYWVRDTRRAGMLVGGTNKRHVVKYEYDVNAKDDGLMALSLPPTPGKPFKWNRRRDLLDVDNAGYT